jgi:hypothetical protein
MTKEDTLRCTARVANNMPTGKTLRYKFSEKTTERWFVLLCKRPQVEGITLPTNISSAQHKKLAWWLCTEEEVECWEHCRRNVRISRLNALLLGYFFVKLVRRNARFLTYGSVVTIWCSKKKIPDVKPILKYAVSVGGRFKFVLVYPDHLKKYVQLRPLKTKQSNVVAIFLLGIRVTVRVTFIL